MAPALGQENGINALTFAPWSWDAAAKTTPGFG